MPSPLPRGRLVGAASASLVALLAALASGCARKTPAKVCDKIGALVRHATDVPALSHDACVEQLEDMMQQDRAAYDCTADCVLGAADATAATACVARCKSPAN